MHFRDNYRLSLFDTLAANGWVWENSRLYPPNRGGWIEGTNQRGFPSPMLERMYGQFKETLDNLMKHKPSHLDAQGYRDLVHDLESLVNVLGDSIMVR